MAVYNSIKIPWPGWHITEDLGEGGYGKVYKIERTQSGISEAAALKVISIPKSKTEYDAVRFSLDTDAEAERYFAKIKESVLGEIKTMQKLKGCSNIVYIDDWKDLKKEDGPGWDIYIRMEILTPFKEWFKAKETTEDEVIKLGMDICNALVWCEKEDFIHRDIKPENILVNKHGDYKLADFGIARELDHTTYVTGRGTPAYISPEINNGDAANHVSDIYSLGLVLYEILNGRRLPFVPKNYSPRDAQAAIQKRLNGKRINEPVNGSPELKRIVLKACAYDPKDRYMNAEGMKRALETLAWEMGSEQAPVHEPAPAAKEKNSDALSLEELEKDLFGESPTAEEYEETKKTDKLKREGSDFEYLSDIMSKKNGHGIYRYADGGIYDGKWKAGKRHGYGKMTYANGDIYEGEWKNGKRNGHGVCRFADGRIYEGEWIDGKTAISIPIAFEDLTTNPAEESIAVDPGFEEPRYNETVRNDLNVISYAENITVDEIHSKLQEPIYDELKKIVGKKDPVIKVIGVGGCGCRIIDRMVDTGLHGVILIGANTDRQMLSKCKAEIRILLGEKIAGGRGAGANTEISRMAAEESIGEIISHVQDADIVFIIAGMGGGTGTGAAPVIANASMYCGALTAAVVTKPFTFEGEKRWNRAEKGIQYLSNFVDSLVVIPNDWLIENSDKGASVQEVFDLLNDVLIQSMQSILFSHSA